MRRASLLRAPVWRRGAILAFAACVLAPCLVAYASRNGRSGPASVIVVAQGSYQEDTAFGTRNTWLLWTTDVMTGRGEFIEADRVTEEGTRFCTGCAYRIQLEPSLFGRRRVERVLSFIWTAYQPAANPMGP